MSIYVNMFVCKIECVVFPSRTRTLKCSLLAGSLPMGYSGCPLIMGHVFQDHQWTPETTDSTKSCSYYVFLYTQQGCLESIQP